MDFANRNVSKLKFSYSIGIHSGCNKNPSWKRGAVLKKHQVCWKAVILFMTIISLGSCGEQLKTKGEEGICTTPGCLAASKLIQKSMDKDVDPCDDFYKFACGGFKKGARIPDGKTSITTFSKVEELLANNLKSILSKPVSADEHEIRPYRLVKQFYAACMNKEKIEKSGLTPLIKLLIRLGGWPLLDRNWNESLFNWEETMFKLRREGLGISYLIDFMVDSDLKNSSNQVIEFDEPSLELDREQLLRGIKDDANVKYHEHMVDIAAVFGADRNQSIIEQRQVLRFEIDLAKITTPDHERQDYNKIYNPMTISEMQKIFVSIQWLEYINNILAPCNKVESSDTVIVSNPNFIMSLESLLLRTPKRVIANYIMWRVVESSINFVSEFFKSHDIEINSTSTKNKPESRWRECVDVTTDRFQIAVGSMYVRSQFKKESKEKAQEMVADIRHEMYETLKAVDWMDQSSKNFALKKARHLIELVGYPDELLDDQRLIKYYEKLEINPDEFFLSSLNLTKFETDYVFTNLKNPFKRGNWTEYGDLDIVDVIYYDWTNTIQISAAVLQPPFFYPDGPRYLNYGSSGLLTAFQMTHAFDDQGSNHDEQGNLVDWWSNTTKEQFSDRAECFVEQYGNYSVQELGGTRLSGLNTRTENIADNGAAKIAYRAYRNWARKNPAEPKLPNLNNFTIPQLFWLNAANTWCANYNAEELMAKLTSDEFAPGEFRVIGSFSNQKEFANDFKCPVGSKMNPVEKCELW